jgi:glycosyltransferase involved in cell wall biosynthesis
MRYKFSGNIMKDLTIVIPAYNEEKRIEKTLTQVGEYFVNKNIDLEVLIVVNNTTDNTVNIIKELQFKYPFIRYANINKAIGKGGALSVGFRKATGKYIAFMDADGASSVAQLNKLYRKISSDSKLDVVIASRYAKGSRINGLPMYRRVLSRLFNIVTRFVFQLPYEDTQCGLKIFKSESAKDLGRRIVSKKWTIDLNLLLLAKYLNLNVASVPIIWSEKGNSTLNVKKAFKDVLKELIVLKRYELEYVYRKNKGLLSKKNVEIYRVSVY